MHDGVNILIIEDEDIVREVYERILNKHYNVFPCKNVSEFDKYKSSHQIHTFLIDLSLGGDKDGLQLIKELRESSQYCNVPIVVVTAHAFNQDEKAALKAGASKFLRKPVENDLLLLTVNELLGVSKN